MNNREYKSDVFSMLMQVPEYALNVYNAMNGSDYNDPDLVEVFMLENGFSLTVRNDASFIVDNWLNIYEHQSTWSPNLVIRELIYYVDLLKVYIKRNKYNVFGRKKVLLPPPKFVVYYNGIEERPEIEEYDMSDLFIKPSEDFQIKVTSTLININPGKNETLKARCYVLDGYCTFVEKVRGYVEDLSNKNDDSDYLVLDPAIDKAIDECIAEDVLADFFNVNRDKVKNMVKLDFSFEGRTKLERAEAYEDGLKDGLEKGCVNTIVSLFRNGVISESIASAELKMEIDDFRKLVSSTMIEEV